VPGVRPWGPACELMLMEERLRPIQAVRRPHLSASSNPAVPSRRISYGIEVDAATGVREESPSPFSEGVASVTLHTGPRPLRLVLSLIACTAAVAATVAVGAAPAHAASRCSPAVIGGHAYLTQPGRVFFSGYDGDERFGVPTAVVGAGATFRIGGNGIEPRETIKFQAINMDTLAIEDFVPGKKTYETKKARDNCVVHEEGPLTVTAPRGRYWIVATYKSGVKVDLGTGAPLPIVDQVMTLVVI
jgi:hypothetical protein